MPPFLLTGHLGDLWPGLLCCSLFVALSGFSSMIKRLSGYWCFSLLLCVFSFFASGDVFAQQVVPRAIYFQVTLANSGGELFNSIYRNTVCMQKTTDYAKNKPTNWIFAFAGGTDANTSGSCYAKEDRSSAVNTDIGAWRRLQCPADKPYFDVLVGQCVSNNPDTPSDPCADKNEFIRRWNYGTGSGPFGAPNHFGQCVVIPLEMLVCRKDASGSYCMWKVKRTGDIWTGEDTPGLGGNDAPEVNTDTPGKSPPIKAPPAPGGGSGSCPAGTVQAGSSSDGVPICMGTGSTPPSKAPKPSIDTSKSEQQPDGSTKTTETKTTTNADGSTTTNTTVTITKPDGSKETTNGGSTTGNSAAGTPGKEDKPEEDNDLCKQNPNLSICRESSVSGTCGAITCVGDAIQCATLRAAAAMRCEQEQDVQALKDSPLKATGQSILNGADPQKASIDSALRGTEVDLSATRLDQAGFVGGGSCFPDKTFSVVGKSVTVSFARVCQDIQPLRAAVMACAFIIAYLIVSRSVLQS